MIIFMGRSISNRLLELLIEDKNCWDAQTYDEVSRLVQYRWGQQVLEWRKWGGDENCHECRLWFWTPYQIVSQKSS